MKIIYLTREDVLTIHKKVVKKSREDNTILLEGNLDLCVDAPKLEVFGQEIHRTIYEKAAVLISSIQKLHPFLHGNKRTGFEACDVFLRMNGYILSVKKDEAIFASLKIAVCSMDLAQTSHFLKSRTKKSMD